MQNAKVKSARLEWKRLYRLGGHIPWIVIAGTGDYRVDDMALGTSFAEALHELDAFNRRRLAMKLPMFIVPHVFPVNN